MSRLLAFVFAVLTVSAVALSSCNDHDAPSSADVNPDAIYLDYRVSGDAETDFVTATMYFRLGGPKGKGLVLDSPAAVLFDNHPVTPDSSRFDGAFYELRMPAAGFGGEHIIAFTDSRGRIFRDTFLFPVFSLDSGLTERIKREELELNLVGLTDNQPLQVIITDTSWASNWVDRNDTAIDGQLKVRADDLRQLKAGPVTLELYADDQFLLQSGTMQGGKLSVSYSLRRNLILED